MGTIAENGIISLMRGDSFTTPIFINVGTKLSPVYHKLKKSDKLYFGLMEPNQAFEDAVLKKVFDYNSHKDEQGNVLLKISPEDTEKLSVGQYYYMIKLKTSIEEPYEEVVRTIVNPTIFWLNGNNPTIKDSESFIPDDVTKIILEGGEIV